MKRDIPLAAATVPLLLLTSGCGLFSDAVVDLNVLKVSVTPAAGKGPFSASVELSAHKADSRLQCYAVPTGKDPSSGDSVYDLAAPESPSNTTVTFEFSPSRGGLQQVVCVDAPPDKVRPDERSEDQVRSNEFSVPLVATGVRSDYATDGTTFCDVPTNVTLSLLPGGTGQLVSDAPGVSDHINCTQASIGAPVSWIADGTADPAAEVVTFTSCNDGRFQGTGQVSYAGGTLKGSVTCSKDGTTWVTVKLG